MTKVKLYFLSVILVLSILDSYAQSTLFNLEALEISKPYQKASRLTRYRYDSMSYEKARTQKEFEFLRFTYESDEFKVVGFMCQPIQPANSIYPVIIYNRGGTGNYGKLTESDLPDFYKLASQGFIVVGSNYRFTGANGPLDQIGGDDINDVVNLYKLLPSIPQADTSNVFMLGVSRGGLMTYKSITQVKVNAAAVIGGVANYFTLANERPIFLEGWDDLSEEENYKGLKNILPGFEKNKEQYLTERSPVKWVDEINAPILILHSRQDGFVTCDQPLEMASSLQEAGKSYQLKIYNEKSHSLPYQHFDSYQEVIEWFRIYMSDESQKN